MGNCLHVEDYAIAIAQSSPFSIFMLYQLVMDSNFLENQNLWWQDAEALSSDQHIIAVEGKEYFFKNPLLDSFDFSTNAFHIVRGPRQVGKTTFIKFLIRDAILQAGFQPENVLFMSCEILPDYQQLFEVLSTWLREHSEKRKFVALDEISFVKEWQRAVLALFNQGLLSDTCLIVTGSNARDLKENSERFPGRRGQGKDISLYPLGPHEYAALPCFSNMDSEAVTSLYLRLGGFPHAIRDYVNHSYVSDETYRLYLNWIVGDAARYGLAEEILKRIMFRVSETIASRITWPDLIKNTAIRSHETALSYLEHLEDSFLCKIVHCYDPDKEGPAVRKARKVYFIDPLLWHLASSWERGSQNIWNQAEHLCSVADSRGKLLEAAYLSCAGRFRKPIYYWYSTKVKKEVDLLLRAQGEVELFDCKLSEAKSFTALGQRVKILSSNNLVNFIADLS